MPRSTHSRYLPMLALALTGPGGSGAHSHHVAPGTIATQGPSCREVRGLRPLLAGGAVLVFGELHGTREAPAFVGDAVCIAAQTLPVILGLELPFTDRDVIESFIEGAVPADSVMGREIWIAPLQYGLTSGAVLGLLETMRRLRASGARVTVAPFDARELSGQARDSAMAVHLLSAARRDPTAVVIALVGNLHARALPGMMSDSAYQPMAHYLSRARPVRSFNLGHLGGTSWQCTRDSGAMVCGERRIPSPTRQGELWSIELFSDAARGYHGRFWVGSLTPSFPAVRR